MSNETKLCPTPKTHVRLRDAHDLWHETQCAYGDPNRFRVFLNQTIQTLRNVSWVLQKEKHKIPGFDSWYGDWQKRMKADKVMKWLCKARNIVVKEGELETHSTASLTLLAKCGEAPLGEFCIPPLATPSDVIENTLKTRFLDGLPDEIVIAVERRWVVDELQEWELLDALAHCYGMLSTIIDDAHAQCGLGPIRTCERRDGSFVDLEIPKSSLGGKLPCMLSTSFDRTAWYVTQDSGFVTPISLPMKSDLHSKDEIDARYGPIDSIVKPTGDDCKSTAKWLSEIAKTILARDGHHHTMAFLTLPNGNICIHGIEFEGEAEKIIQLHKLAAKVSRDCASQVTFVGEMWSAKAEGPMDLLLGASRNPKRTELLAVISANSCGEELSLLTHFSREGGEICFGETTEIHTAETPFLDKIREAWKATEGVF